MHAPPVARREWMKSPFDSARSMCKVRFVSTLIRARYVCVPSPRPERMKVRRTARCQFSIGLALVAPSASTATSRVSRKYWLPKGPGPRFGGSGSGREREWKSK